MRWWCSTHADYGRASSLTCNAVGLYVTGTIGTLVCVRIVIANKKGKP